MPPTVQHTVPSGAFGTAAYQLEFVDPVNQEPASPWHDIPMMAAFGEGTFNFVVEIPMYQVCGFCGNFVIFFHIWGTSGCVGIKNGWNS